MITNMFNDCYPNLGQCRLETSISFCKLESLSEDQASLCCTQQSQTHQSRDSRKKAPLGKLGYLLFIVSLLPLIHFK